MCACPRTHTRVWRPWVSGSVLGYEVLAVLRGQPVFIQTYLLGPDCSKTLSESGMISSPHMLLINAHLCVCGGEGGCSVPSTKGKIK